jgi:predicted dehydrogenase
MQSAGAAAWTALSAGKVLGANERVRVALIGCGGRGRLVMRGMLGAPQTELVAACDVYDPHAQQASMDMAGGKAQTFRDFRKLLERSDVDAVLVATPDHWHSIPAVLALEAGKHVLVEKPFALTIKEGRAMVEAAKRTGRILMPATQHRSAPHIAEAARMVQAGQIGEVNLVRAWNSNNNALNPAAKVADSDPPEGLDWDFYLGPSPKAPYNQTRFRNYRVYYDYSGGYITDFGNHRIDSVHQIMNVQSPLAVSAAGRRIMKNTPGDIFDLHTVTYEYPTFIMEYTANWVNSHGLGGRYEGHNYYNMRGSYDRPHGLAFYGTKGTLMVDRIGWEIYTEPERRGAQDPQSAASQGTRKAFQGEDATALHAQNFVKQVRLGHKGEVDEMTGHTSTAACHLGTIAAKVGRRLTWNAAQESFENDAGASALLSRKLRDGYAWIKI